MAVATSNPTCVPVFQVYFDADVDVLFFGIGVFINLETSTKATNHPERNYKESEFEGTAHVEQL